MSYVTRGETKMASSKSASSVTPERRQTGGAEPRGVGPSGPQGPRRAKRQAPKRASTPTSSLGGSYSALKATNPTPKPKSKPQAIAAKPKTATGQVQRATSGMNLAGDYNALKNSGNGGNPSKGGDNRVSTGDMSKSVRSSAVPDYKKFGQQADQARQSALSSGTTPAGLSVSDLVRQLVPDFNGGVAPSLAGYTQPFDQASKQVADYQGRATADIQAENAALRARLATLQSNQQTNNAQTTQAAQQQLANTQTQLTQQTDPILQQLQSQGVNAAQPQAQIQAAQANLQAQGQNMDAYNQRAGQLASQDATDANQFAADIQSSGLGTLNANAAAQQGQIATQRAGAERQYAADANQFAQAQQQGQQNTMQQRLGLLQGLSPLLNQAPGWDVRQQYVNQPIIGQLFDNLDQSPAAAASIRNDLANPNSDLRKELARQQVHYQLVRQAVDSYEKSLRSGGDSRSRAQMLYSFLSGK